MIERYPYTKVFLPTYVWEKRLVSKQELKKAVLEYMKRYPQYKVTGVEDGFAICLRK